MKCFSGSFRFLAYSFVSQLGIKIYEELSGVKCCVLQKYMYTWEK